MSLLSRVASEIAKHIAINHGVRPTMVTMPKIIYDALMDESEQFMFKKEKISGETFILGVKILSDPDKPALTFFEQK